ncbi:MAG TPA: GntR family transcriptional regulator [Pseudogracilibacillus sp.]|nr:GntR family transcriptional regulator [Pseudogracilibacillus sp.]
MKLPIKIETESREPIYHQIEQQIKTLIASGYVSAEDPLPSIRALAKELEVSVITTRKVYQNLESGGFIYTQQGKGTFVASISQLVKDDTKEMAIYHAFEQAVDTAIQYDYHPIQINDVIQKILKDKGVIS